MFGYISFFKNLTDQEFKAQGRKYQVLSNLIFAGARRAQRYKFFAHACTDPVLSVTRL